MRSTINTELTRIKFSNYKKVFDLSSFFKVKTSDSLFKDNFRMLSMRQLEYINDSVKKYRDDSYKSGIENSFAYFQFAKVYEKGFSDTLKLSSRKIDSINQIIPDSGYVVSFDMASSNISSIKSSLDYQNTTFQEKSRDIRRFDIEWQRKVSLSFACFVLFLIGAPLGSIIRKGGIGAPLVFGINFFVVFHLLNTFGEKLAKEGVMSPFGGMWLASLALLPVGFFLTYKALNDSQLMNKEFYYRTYRRVSVWYKKINTTFKNRRSKANQAGSTIQTEETFET
jgi:lipopolysaccharide export system permease protein